MRFKVLKQISLLFLIGFYLIAGLNHFINPDFYYPLIPKYFAYPKLINEFSGIIEVLLAIGFSFRITRVYAAYGTVVMLLAFIPSHVYFIEIGGCVPEGLCVSELTAWLRLLIIHPLLIAWAFWHRN